MKRLSDDIRQNIKPIIIIIGLWAILRILFHNFCPVVLLCGFPCPGCGLTRAFIKFVTFHPIKAFRLNPAYPLWIVLLILSVWRRYIRGQSLSVLKIPVVITVIITVLIYVYRLKYEFPGEMPMNYEKDNLLAVINPLYNRFVDKFFLHANLQLN